MSWEYFKCINPTQEVIQDTRSEFYRIRVSQSMRMSGWRKGVTCREQAGR